MKSMSRGEVAEALQGADLLLLPLGGSPSVQRSISSKLYEYQATGKPIICCSSGMPGRYVSETGSGLVVEPRDYEGLARSILYLRDHPSDAEEFGENGRRYVESNLSVDKIGLKMKKLLEEEGDSHE